MYSTHRYSMIFYPTSFAFGRKHGFCFHCMCLLKLEQSHSDYQDANRSMPHYSLAAGAGPGAGAFLLDHLDYAEIHKVRDRCLGEPTPICSYYTCFGPLSTSRWLPYLYHTSFTKPMGQKPNNESKIGNTYKIYKTLIRNASCFGGMVFHR